nr:MAG: NUMOD4 motif [Bacteriophage sp.]
MKENIPGYPGYHITKDGKVYTHKSGGWINYKVPESKLSIIFGISKRHINKIVSQYKSGIRWDNNPIKT